MSGSAGAGGTAVSARRLAPRVRLYGLRHLRDPAAADDLVQDVLLMTFAERSINPARWSARDRPGFRTAVAHFTGLRRPVLRVPSAWLVAPQLARLRRARALAYGDLMSGASAFPAHAHTDLRQGQRA